MQIVRTLWSGSNLLAKSGKLGVRNAGAVPIYELSKLISDQGEF